MRTFHQSSSMDKANVDRAKYAAARWAVGAVRDGMRIGLGSGSTSAVMVECLGDLVRRKGVQIVGVPTSAATSALARKNGIAITTLEQAGWLDLTIDGADEFDDTLALIKGGGGAHLMEKIVASASDQMIVICDASKHVQRLGSFPLPVEVIPFGWQTTQRVLMEEVLPLSRPSPSGGGQSTPVVALRGQGDHPFVTDQGNYILDLHMGRIDAPRTLSLALNQVPGVVENGLFIDLCDVVAVGRPDGTVAVHDPAGGGAARAGHVGSHDADAPVEGTR